MLESCRWQQFICRVMSLLSYVSAIPQWFWHHGPGLPHLQLHPHDQNLSALLTFHLPLIILGNLTAKTYTSIQPTQAERLAWSNAVTMLLNADGNCSNVAETIPDALRGIYTVLEVDKEFCALVEIGTARRGDRVEYKKGWGLFVVTPRNSGIHLSAPHPTFDLYTAEQATRIFERAGAKSLYIPGRSREAFREATACVQPGSGAYWKTDAVHDDVSWIYNCPICDSPGY